MRAMMRISVHLERVGDQDDRTAALDDVLHMVELHVVVQNQFGGVETTV